jgi:circadian clock protein KaiC
MTSNGGIWTMTRTHCFEENVVTGIPGLDDILSGGLAKGRVFLLEGDPGAGKTTIALSFVLEGARRGERCLYVTLSETEQELRTSAASHGWTLGDSIEVFELGPVQSQLDAGQEQSLLYASDLELGETTKLLLEAFERVKPARLVIDSLSEIRLLSQSSLRYRRQILGFKQYFAQHDATVLLLDDRTSDVGEKTAHSVVHGVIQLEGLTPNFGAERRRLRVTKYRGRLARGGYHDFTIRTGGVIVFPRLVAHEHRTAGFARGVVTSGVDELDTLLGGGIENGSSTLLLGPSGTGKSLVSLQFVSTAVRNGGKAAVFLFDEELGLMLDRTRKLGFDFAGMQAAGALHIEQLDGAELSPGEFAARVREAVDKAQAKIVMIDSLNGYRAGMPEDETLLPHIHELIQYLNRQGANTFLTVAQLGVVGDMRSPVDMTYMADTVILLRFFEMLGSVRHAISVIKKRTGRHEHTIRELTISEAGLALGEPLQRLQGVLQGVPTFIGDVAQLSSRPAARNVHS